jgi:uncharacterized protein YdhG (YjbR/CyaY superfamily)
MASVVAEPPGAIDAYIAAAPAAAQAPMRELREVIREAAPTAEERLSWGMPTFSLNGNVIHFAAHKGHVGIYPGPSGIDQFADQIDALGFGRSKGAFRLPFGVPVPRDLIAGLVLFRVEENKAARAARRRPSKP